MIAHCPMLKLKGLMTIGSAEHSRQLSGEEDNPDFNVLKTCCNQLQKALQLSEPLALSMGMSAGLCNG